VNTPPEDAIRIPTSRLHAGVVALMTAAGLEASKAELLAGLLVANDLRGVVSHGTRQAVTYAGLIAEGTLNGRPQVRCVAEQEGTATFDGDGGLGYFPAYEAAHWVIAPARRYGVAVALTRNHGHFGAAGIYSRIVVAAGLIAFVTSGHQLQLAAGQSVRAAAGGSPMSFGVPAGKEPPLLLDFGAMHDLYDGSPFVPALFALAPGLVLRNLGLGMVCQVLGGFLAGVPVEEARSTKRYQGANQGSLIIALDPARFLPVEQFTAEMERYHQLVRQLTPLSPAMAAVLPGTLEARREQEYAEKGIPIGPAHRQALDEAARRFGVGSPFPSGARTAN
jgi:LDH2 family malate/lactate/ureidoglycolate dehydrogenase